MSALATLREAEEYFHDQIPLTRAMGVRVVACDRDQFIVEAPVTLNSNHLRTAFGGSLNAVATLAAYGWLWCAVRERNAHVVVVESSIKFLRPVHETMRAICLRPVPKERDAFEKQFATKGSARITLAVNVMAGDQIAARFKGTFLARSA